MSGRAVDSPPESTTGSDLVTDLRERLDEHAGQLQRHAQELGRFRDDLTDLEHHLESSA